MRNKENRVYTHNGGVFFDYRRKATDFENPHFNNEPWHIKENWFILIRLNPRLWERESWYYDGHTSKSVTLLGIQFGKGYSYDSRPANTWRTSETKEVPQS